MLQGGAYHMECLHYAFRGKATCRPDEAWCTVKYLRRPALPVGGCADPCTNKGCGLMACSAEKKHTHPQTHVRDSRLKGKERMQGTKARALLQKPGRVGKGGGTGLGADGAVGDHNPWRQKCLNPWCPIKAVTKAEATDKRGHPEVRSAMPAPS